MSWHLDADRASRLPFFSLRVSVAPATVINLYDNPVAPEEAVLPHGLLPLLSKPSQTFPCVQRNALPPLRWVCVP